ncbi:ABC transporter permease [Actinoplanes couchii]|uniref:ABC transporter permease n=1 Tax=Actinoplanes couchii TaxID=403638 RepID=A0ABQ3X8C9_9ACTN|nr:ABC transporter permease [Actinoplanes couchii]MDR6320219.1 putative spermidine/putrescine transport system permease protein [Actinoplanes couchii]GID54766.1 ABC transporter permease [Actinoplanes couchii]
MRSRRLATVLVAPGTAYLILVFVSIVALLFSYSARSERTAALVAPVDWATWQNVLTDAYTWQVLTTTVLLGLVVSVLTVLVAYPLAWCVHTMRRPWQATTMLFVIFSPILVSVVVRTYGWAMLLRENGPFGSLFDGWLYHQPGVIVALVHVELPFAVFPILAAIRSVPPELGRAAADLGAGPLRRFLRVQLPLTMPGVLSGIQLVFALTISAFATPALLGGGRVTVLAQTIYQSIQQLQWPTAAAQAVLLLILALLVLTLFTGLARLVSGGRAAR